MRIVGFEPTFEVWRSQARTLLTQGVKPSEVVWQPLNETETAETVSQSLYGTSEVLTPPSGASETFRIPPIFLSHAEYVSYHCDSQKWDLLYKILWRIVHEGKSVLDNISDPEVLLFSSMRRSVWIDVHKMHAFVRFRKIEVQGTEHFVAWHRPDHPILKLASNFFVRRLPVMHWSIFTDSISAHWNTEKLSFGLGCPKESVEQNDVFEDLWRTYYGAVFNPARLNMDMLKQKMPKRVWDLLPEAKDIPDLVSNAPHRVATMVKNAPTSAREFLPAADSLDWNGLKETSSACKGCSLWMESTQVVFGEGNMTGGFVFVGEQPGDEEDIQGKPFVGPAGTILEAALKRAGIDRNEIYVTNAVKHFKHRVEGKRRLHVTPANSEISACRPWLEKELDTVKPRVLVCLGASAAQSVLGRLVGVQRERGTALSSHWTAQTLVTYHPSAVLRGSTEAVRAERFQALVEDLILAKSLLLSKFG